MAAKFEIYASGSQFRFRLKAGNGEKILGSEAYSTKQSCKNGIESVKSNAPIDSRYDKKTSVNNKYYFNLKAANYEIIGTSEMYETSAGRDKGIESVKSNAPTASVVDLTE